MQNNINLKDTIKSISPQCKDDFLLNVLNSDEKLKSSFLKYIENCEEENKDMLSHEDFKELVEESSESWKDDLESLNFEPDWEFYTLRHSEYIEEWEAVLHMAEDEIETVFSSWRDSLFDLILEQKIDDAAVELIAMYKAGLISDVKDEYENFDTVNDYFIELHEETLKKFIVKIQKSIVPAYKLKNAALLISEYINIEIDEPVKANRHFTELLKLFKQKK